MKTDWGALYKELEKTPIKEEVRAYPHDEGNTETLTEAEKIYLQSRIRIWDLLENRRKYKGFTSVIYKQRWRKNEPPQIKFHSAAGHTFFQYFWILAKWAQERFDISEDLLKLILYLYPIGIFDREELLIMVQAVFGVKRTMATRKVAELSKKKMIKVWRESHKDKEGVRVPTIYCLTRKAKEMCSKMHSISIGDMPMPSSYRNPLAKGKDNAYKKIIERMNERLEEEE